MAKSVLEAKTNTDWLAVEKNAGLSAKWAKIDINALLKAFQDSHADSQAKVKKYKDKNEELKAANTSSGDWLRIMKPFLAENDKCKGAFVEALSDLSKGVTAYKKRLTEKKDLAKDKHKAVDDFLKDLSVSMKNIADKANKQMMQAEHDAEKAKAAKK